MNAAKFDQPVLIHLGRFRRRRAITTVVEAVRHLKSHEWPAPQGPLARMAASALDGVNSGHVTVGEARQAFVDAALEARILDVQETVH